MERIQTKQSRSNLYTYAHALKVATKLFSQICRSEVQLKYSTALFNNVGLQEDWPS